MFKNVKHIGDNIDTAVYLRRDPAVPRGHKDYIMSRSELMEFARCPFKWINSKPEDNLDTTATRWGSLLDCLILTPDKFDKQFVIQPETYKATAMKCPGCGSVSDSKSCSKCKCPREEVEMDKPWNNNATVCSEWTEKQVKSGLSVVKKEDHDEAVKALEMFRRDSRLVELVKCSRKQVMIVATYVDRVAGIEVPTKVLLDLVPDPAHPVFGKSLSDLKTARSADLHSWDKAVAEHDYDAQAAMFTDIYRAAFPKEDRMDWRFAIQENEPPYVTGRRILSEAFIEIGRAKYLNAFKDYCVCLATNTWPSYDDHGNNRMNGWSFSEPKEWMTGQMYGMGLELPAPEKARQPDERIDFMN